MDRTRKPLRLQKMVIVGATSGIGLRTAERALSRGAQVYLISRDGPTIDDLVADWRERGWKAWGSAADVGDPQALAQAGDLAIAALGSIDSWIHVAGVAAYESLTTLPLDTHRQLFQTNYWGVVHGAAVALDRFGPEGGTLVVVGSIASSLPSPQLGAYAATKHAVRGFVRSLRLDLAAAGSASRVCLVHPAGVNTPLADHAFYAGPGQPRIPPPAHDPDLVARALLVSAVQRRNHDMTVGGTGRLQVLMDRWAPGLSNPIAARIGPLLRDERAPSQPGDNLDGPLRNGRVRGPGWTLRFDPYTEIKLAPIRWTALALGVGLVLAASMPKTRRA